MIATPEQRHANLALWLLLDQGGSPLLGMTVDWHLLLAIAEQNSVLVRLSERVERVGLRPPAFFAAAVERARARAQGAASVMRHIAERCKAHGVAFLFPTAWQHIPDVGGDLDLLVLSREPQIDALILEGLVASLRARDVRDRLAGTALYWLPEPGMPLDVHHGRLGLVGEHASYPATLIRHRRRRIVGWEDCFVPAPEDQLVLQGMSRVSGRRSFSIADVVATVTTVRSQRLDWSYLAGAAHRLGVYAGLCCYLSYVSQICAELYDCGPLPAEAGSVLTLEGWGPVVFRAGRYRFPAMRVRPRLYWRQLATVAGAGEWRAASRLCLVPAMVVAGRLGLVGRDAAAAETPAARAS